MSSSLVQLPHHKTKLYPLQNSTHILKTWLGQLTAHILHAMCQLLTARHLTTARVVSHRAALLVVLLIYNLHRCLIDGRAWHQMHEYITMPRFIIWPSVSEGVDSDDWYVSFFLLFSDSFRITLMSPGMSSSFATMILFLLSQLCVYVLWYSFLSISLVIIFSVIL